MQKQAASLRWCYVFAVRVPEFFYTPGFVFVVCSALAACSQGQDEDAGGTGRFDASDAGSFSDASDAGSLLDAGENSDASDAAVATGDLQLLQDGTVLVSGATTFDFGTILVDSVGVRYTFELQNQGLGPLDVASSTLSGAAVTMFHIDENAPITVPPGESTNLTITFLPTSEGVQTATITITSNDPDTPNYQVALVGTGAAPEDLEEDTDGDWTATEFIAYDTIESRIVVRVGDIDNLGFGWPNNFDPFSGQSTPAHAYPWTPTNTDPPGTDHIIVVSSFVGSPPFGQDGYTTTTSRPDNAPETISVHFDLQGSTPTSAIMQLFVDDFQASVWGADYQVTLDGVRAPFIEEILNSLVQTGPIGKLITVLFPENFVDLLADGELDLLIDDPTTGAGDGFAIDFLKLYIDVYGFKNTGTVTGIVTESGTNVPLADVRISASGVVTTTTDASGAYTLTQVPAGYVRIQATKPGYQPFERLIDLPREQTLVINPSLTSE